MKRVTPLNSVAIVRCNAYAQVEESIRSAVHLVGGMSQFVKEGQRVALKANLLAPAPPEKQVNTDPSVILAVARLVKEAGGTPFLADSPAWGTMQQVCASIGILEPARDIGLEIIECRRTEVCHATLNGHRFTLKHSADVREADVIVDIPKLKAHAQLGFTGATKNMYGCVPGKRKAVWHLRASKTDHHFARKLIEHYSLVKPHLVIMDAVMSMERHGPRGGRPRFLGLILAGSDAVAVDTVAAEVLQAPQSHRLVLHAAKEMGVGETNLEDIEVVGCPIAEVAVSDFDFPFLIGTGFSPLRVLRSVWKQYLITRRGKTAVLKS
jgi:uncharacterized protein (DUF362 family)